jgi:hypothetical protein
MNRRLATTGGLLLAGAVALVLVALMPTTVGAARPSVSPWSVTPTPNLAGERPLTGVSCSAPDDCVAVGGSEVGPVAAHWDGTDWALMAAAAGAPVSGALLGVSCTGPTACVAVGEQSPAAEPQTTLTESWDGTAWTVVPSPNPSSQEDRLLGVSCVTATDCTAVGDADFAPLVESWNGAVWTVVPTPIVAGIASLYGVSCPAVSNCMAAGGGPTIGPFIERWNGVTWSIVTTPHVSGAAGLDGISCEGVLNCTAVGSSSSARKTQALIEQWNGTAWSIASTGVPSWRYSALIGVSCSAATTCVAVGLAQRHANGSLRTLVTASEGGVWTVPLTPNQGALRSALSGVSCQGPGACQGVGSFEAELPSKAQEALIESNMVLTIPTSALPNGAVGQAYSVGIQADGGSPPYQWRIVGYRGLPHGLVLDTATGVISGTPLKSGEFDVTVQVVDTASSGVPSLRHSTSATYTLSIAPRP